MNNWQKVLSNLRSVLFFVLVLFASAALVLAILSVAFRSTAMDKENYVKPMQTDRFCESMYGYLREDLESECLFYDLPFSVLDDALKLEQIEAFCGQYAAEIYDALVNGDAVDTPDWETTSFVNAVQRFFDSLPQEERPLDETAAVTIGTEFSEYAAAVLKGGIRDRFLETGRQWLSHPLVRVLAHKTILFWCLTIIGALGAMLCRLKQWRRGAYLLSFALGMSSFATMIPFWLLSRYSLMDKIALSDSSLKLYIETVFNGVLHEAVTITGVAFGLATVLLIATVVFVCKSTQNVHTYGIDESR